VADGDIGSVRSTLEFDTEQGTYCRIIKVSDTIAAIVACETGGSRKITSVEVNPALPYALTVKDFLIWGHGYCNEHGICSKVANCVLVHYLDHLDGVGVRGQLASILVDNDGIMAATVTDNVITLADVPGNPDCTHQRGNIIAVVMNDSGSDGWIKTFTCTDLGVIGDPAEGSWEFEAGVAQYTLCCRVSDNFIAVVYNDSAPDGWIKTIAINASGAITNAFQDTLKIDDLGIDEPAICHVSGNIYAIVYKDSLGDGKIVTVAIDSSGNIDDSIKDFFVFETGTFTRPSICRVSDTIVAVAYMGPGDDGFLVTIEIDAAGQITEPVHASLEFETTWANYCAITHMQGDIYLIAFQSTDYDGFVVSVDIETPAIAVPHHEMIMKIGP